MFHPDGRPMLPGQDHGEAVAAALSAVAAKVRVLDLKKVWPDMPPKGDVSDWLDKGGTADALYALVDNLPPWSPAAERPNGEPANDEAGPREFAPLEDEGDPAPGEEAAPLPKLVPLKRVKGRVREWNVRDWIPKRTPTLFQGDGGLGKSTILQQWQSSCATNALWLGLPVEECVTLGVYTEDEDQDIDLRQDAIDDAYGEDCVATGKMHMLAMAGADAEMVVFDRAGNPSLTKFYRQVEEAAMDYRVGGVGFDVAVDLYGGNEIMRRQVRAFMRAIAGLARKINGPAIVTAHVSQAGIQSEGGHSGSTDWSNAARSRVYLSAPKADGDGPVDPDARIFSRKKSNHARLGDTIKLKWRNGLFVPEVRAASFFRRSSEDVFLALLDAVMSERQKVSPKPRAGNFARLFSWSERPRSARIMAAATSNAPCRSFFNTPRRSRSPPMGALAANRSPEPKPKNDSDRKSDRRASMTDWATRLDPAITSPRGAKDSDIIDMAAMASFNIGG
jgi:AAA domain